LAGIGILLLAPGIIQGYTPGALIVAVSAVGTGFGSALVVLDIGRAYSFAQRRECALEVLCATSAAALVSLFLHTMPYLVALCVCLAAPFSAVFCARRSSLLFHTKSPHRKSYGERLTGSIVIRFLCALFILGAVTSFMYDVYTLDNDDRFGFEYTLLYSVSALITTVILGLTILLNKRFTIETLSKSIMLLCAISFMIAPAFGAGDSLPFLIVSIGYALFEILVWVILTEVANRFQYTSVQVFGLGRALVLTVGIMAGFFVAYVLGQIDIQDTRTLVFISAIAVSLNFITQGYILPDRVLESLEIKPSAENAQRLRESTRDDLDSDPKDTDPQKKSRLPLMSRCRMIGEHYHLSAREIDVFHLLASGRNAARIQEELVISAGTVNTHLRHIYQKLDVHTHQELIDLMQDADLDAITKRSSGRTKKTP
jgi:DNA-binding CsgD family transcriptional regulator